MLFYKIGSDDAVVEFITEALESRLAKGQSVLWLIPGGSAVAVAAAVAKRLSGKPLGKLTVTLTDERYGPVGHPDSNWLQLEKAGFALNSANLRPVLTGKDMAATVDDFDKFLGEALGSADYRLGFFGIGTDGHTSGILPHSPAVDSPGLAIGYDSDPYRRITTTPAALARLDEAVAYALGQPKWPVLDQLETDLPLSDQPAQVLKRIPKLTIFNDHKGEER